jgi:hypothetical protein
LHKFDQQIGKYFQDKIRMTINVPF